MLETPSLAAMLKQVTDNLLTARGTVRTTAKLVITLLSMQSMLLQYCLYSSMLIQLIKWNAFWQACCTSVAAFIDAWQSCHKPSRGTSQ